MASDLRCARHIRVAPLVKTLALAFALTMAAQAGAQTREPVPPAAVSALETDPAHAFALAEPVASMCAARHPAGDACVDLWLFVAQTALPADQVMAGEAAARRAVAAIRDQAGEEAAVARLWLGILLQHRGRHAEAEVPLRKAMDIVVQREGANSGGAALFYARLAVTLIAFQRNEEAERLLRRAVAILSADADAPPDILLMALVDHGTVLGLLDRHAEAEPVLRRAAAIAQAQGKDGEQMLGMVLMSLGLGLAMNDRPAEAVPMLRRALALCEARFGPVHYQTRRAVTALGAALQQTGDQAGAEIMFRRAAHAHALTGQWDNIDAITAARAVGDAMVARDPAGARIYYARAAHGAVQRIRAYGDYGVAAQAELRLFGPVFMGQVRAAWGTGR